MKETDAMTDSECPEKVDCPAYQPKPPHECHTEPNPPEGACIPLPPTECPPEPKPPDCKAEEYHKCTCPAPPTTTKDCLEKAIDNQTNPITKGEKAKGFKADLEALLGKAKAASQDYTVDKYQKLLKQWIEEDCNIADLIYRMVCTLKCWRCIIECHICPLLHQLHKSEQRLFHDELQTPVHNLYDLLHWQTRDRAAKQRRCDRIKAVLAAWEKPAQTIEKALADNAKLIDDIKKALGTEPSKAVYDLFLKLIPLHLAIAPPAVPNSVTNVKVVTKIDKKYTDFCYCDTGCPDDCCGPDVGVLRMAQRVIGPQPYLIEPKDYFTVICCLVECRYEPAKDQFSEADAAVTNTEALIKRLQTEIDNGLKTFEKDAKAAIPAVVNCKDYEPHDGGSHA